VAFRAGQRLFSINPRTTRENKVPPNINQNRAPVHYHRGYYYAYLVPHEPNHSRVDIDTNSDSHYNANAHTDSDTAA
jgi:hypothetical protein